MELTLLREAASRDNALFGKLFVNGTFDSFTLENADKAIPLGRYAVTLRYSPKFRKVVGLVNDVPGRSAIEIHPANFPAQLEGCIAVGQTIVGSSLEHSGAALDALLPKISEASQHNDATWLTVTESPTTEAA